MGEGLRNFFTYFYVTLSFLPENFNLLTYLLYFCYIRCIIKKAYLQDSKAFFFFFSNISSFHQPTEENA